MRVGDCRRIRCTLSWNQPKNARHTSLQDSSRVVNVDSGRVCSALAGIAKAVRDKMEDLMMPGEWMFFTPDLDGGGSQRVLVSLANGFARQGRDVEIVAMRADGVLRSAIDRRVTLTDFRANYLTVVPHLVRYLRDQRPTSMVAFYNAFTLFPLVAQRFSGIPVRIVPTVHVKVTGILRYSPVWTLRLAYRLALLLWRRAEMVVAVSQSVARDLEKLRIPLKR